MMQLYFLKCENVLKIHRSKSQSKMDHVRNLNLMIKKDMAPIKPNYSLRRVLEKLPEIVANGGNTRAKQLLLGLHE